MKKTKRTRRAPKAHLLKNLRATKRMAKEFVLHALGKKKESGARVFALVGDLGAGKTAFVQAAARALGVRRRMPSPTFLMVRRYALSSAGEFRKLYHLDVYRIKTKRDLDSIHFFRILKDSRAVVFIEWADRVWRYLPRGIHTVRLYHGTTPHERIIVFPHDPVRGDK